MPHDPIYCPACHAGSDLWVPLDIERPARLLRDDEDEPIPYGRVFRYLCPRCGLRIRGIEILAFRELCKATGIDRPPRLASREIRRPKEEPPKEKQPGQDGQGPEKDERTPEGAEDGGPVPGPPEPS